MIASKAAYSDSYAQIQRGQEMALQAQLVWAFLAPRTFATDRVLVAASLEPAYEVGPQHPPGGRLAGGRRGPGRHSSTSLPAPETMRRLNHEILGYQHGRLSDDATAVLIEWLPDQPGRQLTP